jgi:hypothetical protein
MSPPPEYRRRWGPATLWILAGIIVLAVIFGDLPGTALYVAVLQNGCHAPAFAILSSIALILLAAHIHPPLLRATLTIGAMLLVGISTEGIQSLLGRDAELEDVINDVAGSLGAVTIWMYLQYHRRTDIHARLRRLTALLICAGAAAYWLTPFAQCAHAYWVRQAQFPVLAQFRSSANMAFITSSGSDTRIVAVPGDEARGSELALQTTLEPGPWPGITLAEPVGNWRGYHTLALDVGNPGSQALPLTFRVNDRAHRGVTDDRFNLDLVLPSATRRTIRIALADIGRSPRTRRMDMSHIAQLILFHGGAAPGQVVRLYRIWLE